MSDIGIEDPLTAAIRQLHECADERDLLREALKPFANMGAGADLCVSKTATDARIVLMLPGDVIGLRGGYEITLGDLRRASQAQVSGASK